MIFVDHSVSAVAVIAFISNSELENSCIAKNLGGSLTAISAARTGRPFKARDCAFVR
jgi:hypothetical protein